VTSYVRPRAMVRLLGLVGLGLGLGLLGLVGLGLGLGLLGLLGYGSG